MALRWPRLLQSTAMPRLKLTTTVDHGCGRALQTVIEIETVVAPITDSGIWYRICQTFYWQWLV